ncbi:hypothetical protein ScPMuIL_018770 [Solemya velum]
MELVGKVAIVTGAAQGLGRAFARAMIQRGAKVCISDQNVEKGNTSCVALRKELNTADVNFVKCDVTQQDDMKNMFDDTVRRYGGVDIVVNNAGIMNERTWSSCVDINLKGVIQGTLLALEHLQERGGVIINISSIAGVVPVAGAPVYTATKHGVIGFTRSCSVNPKVKAANIRLACLCPTFTDTPILDMTDDHFTSWSSRQNLWKDVEQLGIMKVETVAQGFIQLLLDKDNNGAIMTISPNRGIQTKYYPKARM